MHRTKIEIRICILYDELTLYTLELNQTITVQDVRTYVRVLFIAVLICYKKKKIPYN